MTDFLRVPEHDAEPPDADRPRRRRSYADEGLKVDPAVLQVARRLAYRPARTRATRAEKPAGG